jgi:hypothetical protein
VVVVGHFSNEVSNQVSNMFFFSFKSFFWSSSQSRTDAFNVGFLSHPIDGMPLLQKLLDLFFLLRSFPQNVI